MVLTTTGEAAAKSGSVKPTNDFMVATMMLRCFTDADDGYIHPDDGRSDGQRKDGLSDQRKDGEGKERVGNGA
jgi:hypothetical protein